MVLLCLIGLAILPACQNTDDVMKPGESDAQTLYAVYVPDSIFVDNPIELNGEMLEREWGGPLDADLPFHQIRVSGENGEGDVGTPAYVAMKCIYTDSDIYFLLRWTDPGPTVFDEPLVYVGPDYDPELEDCSFSLIDPANWFHLTDVQEDKLVVQFDIPDVEGASAGRRDVWEWLAARGDVPFRTYNDDEDPRFPKRGFPGYLEDAIYDPAFGQFFDPGTSVWRRNYSVDSFVPTFVYRESNDPFFEPPDGDECRNGFGGECRQNNGLPFYFLWREDPNANVDHFAECDTTNFFPVSALNDEGFDRIPGTDGDEPRYWRTFDLVSSYWYTYPEGSRADVRGKAVWVDGVWTLEVGRPLRTGDTANDLAIQGLTGETIDFTLQVYNASEDEFKGSGPQVLHLAGPRVTGNRRPGEES